MIVLAHIGQPIHDLWDGLAHPFTGVDHLLAMASVGIIAALATSRRVAWLTPVAFVGGMICGGILGMLGVGLPAGDSLIAASVLACGALLLLGTDRIEGWLPIVAAVFGLFHGVAHGAEAPSVAQPIAYVAGFVIATCALHASGAAAGWVMRFRLRIRVFAGVVVSGAGVALLATV